MPGRQERKEVWPGAARAASSMEHANQPISIARIYLFVDTLTDDVSLVFLSLTILAVLTGTRLV